MTKTKSGQSGNILFLILIAVALFAALSYVVTNSSRGTSGSISNEAGRLQASEVLNFSTSLRTAVSRMQALSCKENELDFYTPYYTRNNGSTPNNTANSNAPSDERCNLFSHLGGKLTPYIPSANALDLNNSGLTNPSDYIPGHPAFRAIGILGVGTNYPLTPYLESNDLVMVINYLNKQTCMAINDLLNVPNASNDAPTQVHTGTEGDYTNGAYTGTMVNSTFNMKAAFCQKTATSNYQFMMVIIER